MDTLGPDGWDGFVRAAGLAAPSRCFDPEASAALLARCEPLALARWLHVHRVEAAAADNLRTVATCPPALLSALDTAGRENTLRALGSAYVLRAVSEAFARDGIRWVCLKGVVLSARYYGGLATRHAGDVDLLIAPEALPAADRRLRALGYAPTGPTGADSGWLQRFAAPVHEVTYTHPHAAPIELHHRLHPNPALIPLPVPQLLAGKSHVLVGDLRVPALDPATEILYLATHGVRHAWHRLQWVLDMAMLALQRGPALEQARALARRLGVERPLLDGLLLAHSLFGTPLPRGAATAVGRSRRLRYLHGYSRLSLLAHRDETGLPFGRARSSFIASLCQANGLKYAAHQTWLRARHEVARCGMRSGTAGA